MKKSFIKVFLLLLAMCILICVNACIAFGGTALPGKIFSFMSIDNYANREVKVDVCKNSQTQLSCGEYPNGFDRSKLTAFKLTVNVDGDTAVLDLFSDKATTALDNKGAKYRLIKSGDGIRIANDTAPEIYVTYSFDPFVGVAEYGSKYVLTANWIYEGKEYEAKTTINTSNSGERYRIGSFTDFKPDSNGIYTLRTDEYYVCPADMLAEYSISEDRSFLLAYGTTDLLKFEGCAQDPEGQVFSEAKVKYTSFLVNAEKTLDFIKVDQSKAEIDKIYTLNLRDSNGKSRTAKVCFSDKYLKNVKSQVEGNTITLSWDKCADALEYRLLYHSTTIIPASGNDPDRLSYTLKGFEPGTTGQLQLKVNYSNVSSTYILVPISKVYFAIKPDKVSNLKLTSGSKYLKASWKETNGTGYQIQISTDSKFTKGKKTYTVSKSSTISKKITKLTKGKKYYVRVRAIANPEDGNKVYGKWSSYKSITVK